MGSKQINSIANPRVTDKFIIVEDTGDDSRQSSARTTIASVSSINRPKMTKRRAFDNRSILLYDKSFLETTSYFKTHSRNAAVQDSKSIKSMSDIQSTDSTLCGSTINQKVFVPINYDTNILGDDYSATLMSDYDPNYPYQNNEPEKKRKLIQGLGSHTVAFITLCSVFGTGLFMTSSTILQIGGPLSLIMGYGFMGLLAYQVVSALSDMSTYIPLPDNFSGFAQRFVDPALGFATGYAFLLTFLLFAPNQISAATLAMSYWIDPKVITPAIWILLFIILIALVNYCKITKYAFLVDAFIITKLLIYFIIAVTFICLILGGGPKHDRIGFRYWKNPGCLAAYGKIQGPGGKIAGLLISITKSVWSYVGIESFSVAAIETANPREKIPKAKRILFNILLPTYIIVAFLVGLAVAHNDHSLRLRNNNLLEDAKGSVIFIALYNASLNSMGNFINAALLIFIFSAANTGFYLSTRILYGLSASGNAPKCFTYTTKSGVPLCSFLLVLGFNVIAFASAREKTAHIYHYFVDAISLFSLINWACILITHIRFLSAFKKQNMVREFKAYVPKSSTSVIPSSIALVSTVLLVFLNNLQTYIDSAIQHTFKAKEFFAGIIAIPVFIALYLGYKLYYKTSVIDLQNADLFFYRDVIDRQEKEYLENKLEQLNSPANPNFVQRLRSKINPVKTEI